MRLLYWFFLTCMLSQLVTTTYAQTATSVIQPGRDSIVIKASIVIPSCIISNDVNDVIDFGVLSPNQIRSMPDAGASIKNQIIAASALGPRLSERYRDQLYGTRVTLDCPTITVASVANRMQLTFGNSSQVLTGSLGASTQGYAFKLDSDNALVDLLSIIIYAEDHFALSNSVQGAFTGLVKPGVGIALSTQSFSAQPASRSVAYFDLFPGLFWANPPEGIGSPNFRLETDVALTYN